MNQPSVMSAADNDLSRRPQPVAAPIAAIGLRGGCARGRNGGAGKAHDALARHRLGRDRRRRVRLSGWRRRSLPAFRMARYPITNSPVPDLHRRRRLSRRALVDGSQRPEPEASHWPQANRPRTNVNWYEAVAFCRWLSAHARRRASLADRGGMGTRGARRGRSRVPVGQWVRKRGARTSTRRWDKMRANGISSKRRLSASTHTGLRAKACWICRGTSGSGAATEHEHPEQIQADTSGQARVLRGGSWLRFAGNARGALARRAQPCRPRCQRRFSRCVVCPHFLIRCPLMTAA
jgi:hypothetical protein